VSRTGKYKKVTIFGAAVLFVSVIFFAIMLSGNPDKWTVVWHLIPLGIGMGAMMSIFNMIIQMVYPRERLGEVTGALQLVRGIGGTFGTALLGFIFGSYVKDLTSDYANIPHAVTVIFYVLIGFSAVSLVSAFFMKEGTPFKLDTHQNTAVSH
jgi:MFS family permease